MSVFNTNFNKSLAFNKAGLNLSYPYAIEKIQDLYNEKTGFKDQSRNDMHELAQKMKTVSF